MCAHVCSLFGLFCLGNITVRIDWSLSFSLSLSLESASRCGQSRVICVWNFWSICHPKSIFAGTTSNPRNFRDVFLDTFFQKNVFHDFIHGRELPHPKNDGMNVDDVSR